MKLKIFICIFWLLNTCAIANNLAAHFKTGIGHLMQYYNPKSGLWQDLNCVLRGGCIGTEGYWYWGNAIHVLADYQYLTGDKPYYAKELGTIYAKNQLLVIGRNYFDDDGWWALAFIEAYTATTNIKYLIGAKRIVKDMKSRGAQHICHGSGGIYWDAKKTQVGSIANELYIAANAKLYLLTHKNKYKVEANNTWNWFKNSGLLNNDYTIADNYEVRNGKCGNKTEWRFSYTNGVILTALADLAKINHQNSLLRVARNIAKRTMYDFSMGGVLTEICTNVKACAEDAFLFKGIFAYHLAYLANHANDKAFKNEVKNYLTNNYKQLVARQGYANNYAFNWSLAIDLNTNSPVYNPVDIVTELSALYLIDAVYSLNYPHSN